MGGVTEVYVAAVIGRTDELVIREIVRTGASRSELRRALALAKGPDDLVDPAALPPRMRRLVDLLAITLPEQGPRPLQGPQHRLPGAMKDIHRAA